jgi:hypothetical protein
MLAGAILISCAWAYTEQLPATTSTAANPSVLALDTTALPSAVRQQVAALGTRIAAPGQERLLLTGTITDSTGARPATVTLELPASVTLQGADSIGSIITFDGVHADSGWSPSVQKLMETFATDTAEGMFQTFLDGAAARLLGRNFGPDPRQQKNYTGPRLDIYEVTAPVRTRVDPSLRTKMYQFDSKTALLRSTRYYDRTVTPPISVESRFSGWTTSGGSLYPGTIERYENQSRIFSFVVASAVASPKQSTTGSNPQ